MLRKIEKFSELEDIFNEALKEHAQTEVTGRLIIQAQTVEATDRPETVQILEVLSAQNGQTADGRSENEVHQTLPSDGTDAEKSQSRGQRRHRAPARRND